MKRIQLFEFEDFNWFPKTLRTGMTNLLIVLHKIIETKDVISNLIIGIRERHYFTQIIDLGSGSGGIMPEVIEKTNNPKPINLVLTDLHPNPNIVKSINETYEHISYYEESVDATNLSSLPNGLKTMINSFHHIPPNVAKNILKSAQDNKQPLFIYEIAENKIPTIIWWLFLPISLVILFIMSWIMTPFVKSLTLQQLLFTYLIPIIPICYAWDGQASLVRMYTFSDIESLLADFKNESQYTWEINQAKKANGKNLGYYILGLPK